MMTRRLLGRAAAISVLILAGYGASRTWQPAMAQAQAQADMRSFLGEAPHRRPLDPGRRARDEHHFRFTVHYNVSLHPLAVPAFEGLS